MPCGPLPRLPESFKDVRHAAHQMRAVLIPMSKEFGGAPKLLLVAEVANYSNLLSVSQLARESK
jgi:hypothetical protein